MPNAPLQPIATLGIDIGKNSFHLIGLDARGAIVLHQKLSRGQVEACLSKRGNTYLRSLLVQAARVLLLWPAKWPQHSFGNWRTAASARLHHNVLAAALANKLARIAWSVLSQNRRYEPRTVAVMG